MSKKIVKKTKQTEIANAVDSNLPQVKAQADAAPAAKAAVDKRASKRPAKAEAPAEPAKKSKTEAAATKASKATKSVKGAKAEKAAADVAASPALPVKVAGIEGPVRQGPEVYFARADLAKLEIAQLKATSAKQAAELQQSRIETFQAEVTAKLAAAKEELKKLASAYQTEADAIAKLYRDLGQAYALDMSKTTYDPITGRIQSI